MIAARARPTSAMGYPVDIFVDGVKDAFICGICTDVKQDPTNACAEGHSYCHGCVLEACKRSPRCPECRALVKTSKDKTARNMISEMKVRCPNELRSRNTANIAGVVLGRKHMQRRWDSDSGITDVCVTPPSWGGLWSYTVDPDGPNKGLAPLNAVPAGSKETTSGGKGGKGRKRKADALEETCAWTGSVDDIQKHEESCGFVNVICPNSCSVIVNGPVTYVMMQRRFVEAHLSVCPRRKLPCEHCHKNIAFEEMRRHVQLCPAKPMKCEKCNEVMRSGQIPSHLSTTCPKVAVKCPVLGCPEVHPREKLNEHMTDSMVQHAQITADRMKIVEDRMKEQLQKIEHLTRENHGMRQQINQHDGKINHNDVNLLALARLVHTIGENMNE